MENCKGSVDPQNSVSKWKLKQSLSSVIFDRGLLG